MHESRRNNDEGKLSRRRFIQVGGVALAGSALPIAAGGAFAQTGGTDGIKGPKVTRFRKLGRTGFQASDVSIGCGGVKEGNVIRYAYDHGVNYFDTAEGYGNGASETAIGEALPHMNRKKVFITTKLPINPEEDTYKTISDRFARCLERLKTPYADALMMHSVNHVDHVTFAPFHAAANRLVSEGKLRFKGISCHGPRDESQNSMGDVLLAAAEDSRFDVMLFSYNWLNKEEAERVLAACKKYDIGTTAMKVMPGYIELEPYNPENPQEDYEEYIANVAERGISREEAIERINNWVARQTEKIDEFRPYLEKYGITTDDQLRAKSLQWALGNADMHTVCVSMPDFETIDQIMPLSGTQLSQAGAGFLKNWNYAYGNRYCRHGCTDCMASCPDKLPVSTIMRYAYYFDRQGREKHAMRKYAKLGAKKASPCLGCDAPCSGACPHGVDIQMTMVRAHSLLNLA